jgi:hypothetical protein
MALGGLDTSNINYLEDDAGFKTRINIYKYQRPRPGAKLLVTPQVYLTLPLPMQMPEDHYSMQIGQANLGEIGNATGGNPSGESLSQLEQTLKERLGTNSTAGTAAAALGLAAAGASPMIADLTGALSLLKGNGGGAVAIAALQGAMQQASKSAQATLGVVRNPHTALLFNGVDLRTFTFTWKLSPRSQEQSKNLDKIINSIKRAMHPNLTLGGFALDYPNLFTVEFENDKEGIVELGYSFCSDFRINPTPSGQVFYKNGYPSIVEMSMTLKEFQIKTAENFTYKYGGQNESDARLNRMD